LRSASITLACACACACAEDRPAERPIIEANMGVDSSRRVVVAAVHPGLVQVLVSADPGRAWRHIRTTSSPFAVSPGEPLQVVVDGEVVELEVVAVSGSAAAPASAIEAKRRLEEAIGARDACGRGVDSPACAFVRSGEDCSGQVDYVDGILGAGVSIDQMVDGYVLHWTNLGGTLDAQLPGRCVFSSATPSQQAAIANRLRRHVFTTELDLANRIYSVDALYALELARGGEPVPTWLVDLAASESVLGRYATHLVDVARRHR
jgi:hypothetical protein